MWGIHCQNAGIYMIGGPDVNQIISASAKSRMFNTQLQVVF